MDLTKLIAGTASPANRLFFKRKRNGLLRPSAADVRVRKLVRAAKRPLHELFRLQSVFA